MGKPTRAVDALGRETAYVYGAFGNLYTQTLSGTGFQPVEISFGYDDAGRMTSSTDGLGRTTSFTLDALGRTSVTTLNDPDGPLGPLAAPTYSQTFSSLGTVASSTDALGNVTSVQVSNFGRTVTTTLADPDGPGAENPLTSPVYVQNFDLLARLESEVGPTGGITTYTYNMLSRLVQKVLPDPGPNSDPPVYSWTHDKNGNILTEADPLLNTTEFVWDSRDRLVEKRLEDPDSAGPLGIPTILYVWDDANNLMSLTDPAGNTTSWLVDNLNRVIEETNELLDTRFFHYDAASRLVEKTDRNERIIQYDYDLLDNVTREKWLVGQTIVNEIVFAFDAGSQLLTASDDDSAFAFVYDGLGRTTEISADYVGLTPEIVMAQAFDANSNRTQLAATLGVSADFVNDFSFDNLSRLARIEQHGATGGNSVAEKRIDLAYNSDSSFDAISRYADLAATELVVTTNYLYDGLSRLTDLEHVQGATTLASYAFTYDAGSRITSIDSLADGLAAYSYDNTSQLVGADFANQTDETHQWDENGNHAAANFQIGPNNKILSDGTFNYQYDDEGNLVRKTNIATGGSVEFVWDHRNRLIGVINRDVQNAITQEVHYAYDFLDRWIARTADEDGAGQGLPTSTFFVYDGTQIVLELDSPTSEEPAHRYLWGAAVDQLMADENALGDVLYPLADHLNTVRDLAEYDSAENATTILDHIKYESFGKVVSESNPAEFRFLFTGRPIDEFTGLQNNWHRWYSVDLGWWLSEDPLSFAAGTTNLNEYVGNAPVAFADPTGLKRQKFVMIRVSPDKMPATFNPKGVQKQLQAILDKHGVGVKVIITVGAFKDEQLGFHHYVTRYFTHCNGVLWANMINPFVLVHDGLAVFTWTPMEYDHNVTWNTTIAMGPHAFTGWHTYNTQIFQTVIENNLPNLGGTPNWDIFYANMLLHEVFYLGAMGQGDDLSIDATPFEGGNMSGYIAEPYPLQQCEADAINRVFRVK